MTKVVIDTNILVSSLLSPYGAPGRIVDMMLTGNLTVCYDSRILSEYSEVLERPKFGFNKRDVKLLIDFIASSGISVIPAPLSVELLDEDDRAFLEVAKHCDAFLITGNKKHYPDEEKTVTVTQFLDIQQLPNVL